MGLENLANAGLAWGPYDKPSGLSNVEATAAGNYMNGYSDTEFMMKKTDVADYPIFAELGNYRSTHAVSAGVSRSPWFIPSIGQWFDVMTNLCGKSPADFEMVSSSFWMENTHAPEMYNRGNQIFNKVGRSFPSADDNPGELSYFWCSSQLSKGLIYRFSSVGQESIMFETAPSTGFNYYYVRPFFAF